MTKRMKMYQRKRHRQKNLILKKLLEIFHGVKSTKDRSLEAAPNLKRSMMFTKAQERCLLHTVRRQAIFQLLLIDFLAKKTPQFSMFLIFQTTMQEININLPLYKQKVDELSVLTKKQKS